MKNFVILLFLLVFSLSAFPQKPTPRQKAIKPIAAKLGSETEEFEKAKAVTEAAERIAALQNFIQNFPNSAEIAGAQAFIVSARAELGDQKLRAGDAEAGIALFKLAVEQAPAPVPDELFAKVILGFPIILDSRGQRAAAFDIARIIEEKIGANPNQILSLSKFFVTVQYGTEAIRLAEKAVQLAPDSAVGFQTLAVAYRLNFRLEDAANAYAKSLELDAESTSSRLSLADLKRSLGKPDDAIALYRQILERDATDKSARTGLTLALFDAGKRAAAETEMTGMLEADPNNPQLLVGAAYWYAARNESEKAIELAEKASAIDPRFVWAHIAKARALLAQKKPLEAEKILLLAKQYGDFPTLDYELAAARMAAGLYREAAESLKKNFTVNQDGLIETYLGNRILADAKSFTELLSLERRAEIYEQTAADNVENAGKLKALLEFHQKLEAADVADADLVQAADEFVNGADNMRLHRQLFAANRLLQKKAALPKVLDLTRDAIASVDSALNVPNPSAAVLAEEIYDSRQFAIIRNQIIVVPEIPRQTLSAILRGRIEEIAGWTLYQQNDKAQSIVRLKRALSVLPEKSAWWRSSQWRLGAVFAADGKEKEALEAYIKGYDRDEPDMAKRIVIEGLYQKLNGSLDGLDAKIGQKPDSPVIAVSETKPAQPNTTDNVRTTETKTKFPSTVPLAEPSPVAGGDSVTQTEVKTEARPIKENGNETTVEARPTPEVRTSPKADDEIRTAVPTMPSPELTPQTSPASEEKPKTDEVETEEITDEVKETPTLKIENPAGKTTENPVKAEVSSSPSPTDTPVTEVESSVAPTPKTSPVATPTPETVPTSEPVNPSETTNDKTTPETKPGTRPEPTPEPTPDPQFVAASETKPRPPVSTAPKTDERKTANKPAVVVTDSFPTAETPVKSNKTLFEPVVISIPKTETAKPVTKAPAANQIETVPKKKDEKPAETQSPRKAETPKPEKPNSEKKSVPPVSANKQVTNPADTDLSGETRPRVAVFVTDRIDAPAEEIKPCRIVASHESLSIINDGGTLGVFVRFRGEGNLNQIIASSSSPANIQVTRELGVGENSARAFFIIKSISAKTGAFTVTFEAPCGKKEILVKVR